MSDTETLVRVDGLVKYFYENDTLIDRLLYTWGRFRSNGASLKEAFVEWEPTAVRAVDGLDFEIRRGETLGLVGESGCGKSTTGEAVLRLQEATDGSVRFEGQSIFDLEDSELKAFRRSAQAVFQDPFSSLDPRMTIGKILREPLDIHGWPQSDPSITARAEVSTDGIDPSRVSVSVADDIDKVVSPDASGVVTANVTIRGGVDGESQSGRSIAQSDDVIAEVDEDLAIDIKRTDDAVTVHVSVGRSDKALRRERAKHLLEIVGLASDQLDRYPHEFSGGQRQRIGIARALALEPEFLVLDEPTSALDVSVQAQILNLLEDLQDEFDLTYLLISHDLSVIGHVCDRVAVMYLGEIVEIGPVDEIFDNPRHPYTQALLESIPRADTKEAERDREPLAGDVPSPRNPPSGCRFRTRCPKVIPPEHLDIDQTVYRAVMDFRHRIEQRDISLEAVEDDLVGSFEGEDDFVDEDRDRFVAAQKQRLFDVDLDASTDSFVTEALKSLFEEEWEDAAALMRDRFYSICERENPSLDGEPHLAACHLLDSGQE